MVGESRNKCHSSSTNMYKLTLLTRERTVSCISLLSYSLLSLKGKKQSFNQTNKQTNSPKKPTVTLSQLILIYSFAAFANRLQISVIYCTRSTRI